MNVNLLIPLKKTVKTNEYQWKSINNNKNQCKSMKIKKLNGIQCE